MRNLRSVDALLLLDVDHGDDGVGDAHRLQVHRLTRVGFLLVGGAFAGEGARGHQAGSQRDTGN